MLLATQKRIVQAVVPQLTALGQALPRPAAVLVVSPHWITSQVRVGTSAAPETIHDFGGFPDALFQVQYPAPGSPELAHTTQEIITATEVFADEKWGLDHGTWSVLKHVYPNADIPVVQLSLDYTKGPEYHYALAKELSALRNKGVLIIGSGNMVHNLGRIDWDGGKPPAWASNFEGWVREKLAANDVDALLAYREKAPLPDEAHQNNLRVLYSANRPSVRRVPSSFSVGAAAASAVAGSNRSSSKVAHSGCSSFGGNHCSRVSSPLLTSSARSCCIFMISWAS